VTYQSEVNQVQSRSFASWTATAQNILPKVLICALAFFIIREQFGQYKDLPSSSWHAAALLVTMVVIGVVTRFAHEVLAFFSLSIAIYYTATIFGISGNWCSNCDSAGHLSMGMIIGTLAFLLAAGFATKKFDLSKSVVPLICYGVIFVQIGLLIAYPKVCPPCISTGISALIVSKLVQAGKSESQHKYSWLLPIAILSIVGVMPALVATRSDVTPIRVGSPVGTKLSDMMVSEKTITAPYPKTILATAQGCHWCDLVRKDLTARHVPFVEVSARDFNPKIRPLDPGFAPQIFICENGTVVKYIKGYDKPEIDRINLK
jgi:hypothetical protein